MVSGAFPRASVLLHATCMEPPTGTCRVACMQSPSSEPPRLNASGNDVDIASRAARCVVYRALSAGVLPGSVRPSRKSHALGASIVTMSTLPPAARAAWTALQTSSLTSSRTTSVANERSHGDSAWATSDSTISTIPCVAGPPGGAHGVDRCVLSSVTQHPGRSERRPVMR